MKRMMFWLAADIFCCWRGVIAWTEWENAQHAAATDAHFSDISTTMTDTDYDENGDDV